MSPCPVARLRFRLTYLCIWHRHRIYSYQVDIFVLVRPISNLADYLQTRWPLRSLTCWHHCVASLWCRFVWRWCFCEGCLRHTQLAVASRLSPRWSLSDSCPLAAAVCSRNSNSRWQFELHRVVALWGRCHGFRTGAGSSIRMGSGRELPELHRTTPPIISYAWNVR